MDIAISIASAVSEVCAGNPDADKKELFEFACHIGRDMAGTMANTLILAFTGSSLTVLIQIYTYNMQFYQVMNSSSIAIEIIQSLAGCFAVITAVPVSVLLSANCCQEKK